MPDLAPRSAPVLPWTHLPWAMQRPALHQFLRAAASVDQESIRATIEAAAAAQAAAQEARSVSTAASGSAGRDAEVPAVAVIPLVGPITPWPTFSFFGGGSSGLMNFRAELARAVADPNVKAIVLDVDSPGGLVSLVPETAAEIRAARDVKPIIAVANTLAASAAYWLASQATEVVVTPSGDVGSVGVYIQHLNYAGWNEKAGIEPTFVFAEASPRKVDGNMEQPLSDEARATLQEDVDAICEDFIAGVAAGRGLTVEKVKADFGQGRTLRAQNALKAGMVDRVATLEEVIATAASKAAGSGANALGKPLGQTDGDKSVLLVGSRVFIDCREVAATVVATAPAAESAASDDPDADAPVGAEPGEVEATDPPSDETPEAEALREREFALLFG